jgi:DNA-binding beta-propeller fold protein YncE
MPIIPFGLPTKLSPRICFATAERGGATKTGKIYFLEAGLNGGGAIKVIDADGANETALVDGDDANEPDGIEIDAANGKMYWTSMGPGGSADRSIADSDGRIMRANLDGSDVEVIVPLGITTTPKQLALDLTNRKVYWSDRGDVGKDSVDPKIMRADLDGANVEVLIKDNLISPVGITLDVAACKLYFSERFANNIKRANLDGSNVEIVVQNTSYPVDLIIELK